MKWHSNPEKLVIHDKLVRSISYDRYDSAIKSERYSLNGKSHNPNGPAYREWVNDKIGLIYYYINGELHNSNGPAIVSYDSNELPLEEEYYENDKFIKRIEHY